MNKKRKVRPIKYYINDKEEMINQIFSCISEKQFQKMTPVILKDMSTDELKAECLVHLLNLSNDAIINIIEGRKLYPNENKSANDDSYDADNIDTISNVSIRKSEIDSERNSVKEQNDEWKLNSECLNSGNTSAGKRKQKERKHKSVKKKKKNNNEEEINDDESKGRNLLELLELEMRAKAIRSLLKKEEELEKLKGQRKEERTDIDIQKFKSTNSATKENEENSIKTNLYNTPRSQFKNRDNRQLKEEKKCPPRSSENQISLDNDATIKDTGSKEENNALVSQRMSKEETTENTGTNKKKEDYDWTEEDEKLIYEDDEYESDDNKHITERNKEEEKSEENSSSSWAERWLQSKDVKKVVATSKMLTVVRNKMKNNFKLNTKQTALSTPISSSPRINLEGSVKEYDTLLQMHEAVMSTSKIIAPNANIKT